jgi:hypothetical protein
MKLLQLCLVVCVGAHVAAAQVVVNDEPPGALPVFDGVNPAPPSGISGVFFDNLGATTSVGYGSTPCGNVLHSDVFFLYAPATTGTHVISTAVPAGFVPGRIADTTVYVYDVNAPTTNLGCDDDGANTNAPAGSSYLSRAAVALTAGSNYYIRVASWSGYNQGEFYLKVLPPTSGNEDCATAMPITDGSYAGQLFGATASGTTIAGCTNFLATTVDQYWSYTAPFTGECVLTREVGPGTMRSYVSSGPCGAEVLEPTTCQATFAGVGYLHFPVTAGNVYNIRFGVTAAPGTALAGVYDFSIASIPTSTANDTCVGAFGLATGANPAVLFGMTADPATGACASNFTVGTNLEGWYVYTALTSSVVSITLCNPMTTYQVAVYTAGVCGGLTGATCPAPISPMPSTVTATAAAGQTLYVRVGSTTAASSGVANLFVEETPLPPDDNCAGASPLVTGLNGPFTMSLAATLSTPAASCSTQVRDLWYSWTATDTGTVKVNACGSNQDPVLAVYSSCGGSELACDDDDLNNRGPCATTQTLNSYLEFAAVAGTTYYVRVGNFNANVMTFFVDIRYKFSLTITKPAAFDVEIRDLAGTPGNFAFNAITLVQGAFPNGWFYGVDIPFAEILTEANSGPPFLTVLDGSGGYSATFTGIPFLGLTFYTVGVEFSLGGVFVQRADAVAYTI